MPTPVSISRVSLVSHRQRPQAPSPGRRRSRPTPVSPWKFVPAIPLFQMLRGQTSSRLQLPGQSIGSGWSYVQYRATLATTDPTVTPTLDEVRIDANKAGPSITWTAPANIVYGTPLSATQLNATSDIQASSPMHPPWEPC